MSDSARSPLSGCLILIAAVVMLIFLVGFAIWVPFRQADAIEKFTLEQPEPVALLDPAELPTETDRLVERLRDFQNKLKQDDTEARIELTARDLNLAIARFQPLEELRGTFHIREITDGTLVADICYRLNGRPRLAKEGEDGPITADPRYLVGTLTATPQLGKRELALRVEDLQVEDAEIDPGFMGHFTTLRIFEGSKDDPDIGPAMATLTRAAIEGDQLVLARIPGDPIPEVVSDEQFRAGGGRIVLFLGGAMLIFLILAGTVLFLGYKAQLRKIQAEIDTKSDDSDATNG